VRVDSYSERILGQRLTHLLEGNVLRQILIRCFCLVITLISLASAAGAQNLAPGDIIRFGDVRYSQNGQYRILWKCNSGNGNCFLIHEKLINGVWQSWGYVLVPNPTLYFWQLQAPAGAYMQLDGNFVAYDENMVWRAQSMTGGNSGAYLNIQNDGNPVIYSANHIALWTPACHLPQPRYSLPPGGCP
jgi:hypothetical protein